MSNNNRIEVGDDVSPEWEIVHNYRELINLELVGDFECPACGHDACITVGDNDLPAIKCYWCGVLTHPGQRWYDGLQEQISEILPE